MTKEEQLESKVQDILLKFALLFNELTTSDLQGAAIVKAKKIIEVIKNKEN